MKKYIAEGIGTLVLTLFGCGAAVTANTLVMSMGLTVPLGLTTLIIAVAFGLSIVAMAYSIGNVSGCHINPAVSIGMLVAGRMNVKDFVGYVVAQVVGATVGAAILMVLVGQRTSLGQNGYGSASALGINAGVAFLVEVILTFVFVLVMSQYRFNTDPANMARANISAMRGEDENQKKQVMSEFVDQNMSMDNALFKLRIGSHPVTEINLSSLMDKISYVSQDNFL